MNTNPNCRPANALDLVKGAASTWLGAAFLFSLLIFCMPAGAQVNRDAYQLSNLDEMMAAYRLQVDPDDLAVAEAHLIKPQLRYRLRIRATGQIRELMPDAIAVLRALNFRYAYLSEFLNEYTHEIEVLHRDRSIWFPLQRRLVVPFVTERQFGGMLDAYVVLVGSRGDELLLLVTAYEAK